MKYPIQAAIAIIFSVGLVLSYPSVMHPPLRRVWGKILRPVVWPFHAIWRFSRWLYNAPSEWMRYQRQIPRLAKLARERELDLSEAAGRMWLETQFYAHKPRFVIGKADRDHGAFMSLHDELLTLTFGRPVWEEEWFKSHNEAFRRPPLDQWWQLGMWSGWIVWRTLALIFILTYTLPRLIPRYRRLPNQGLRKLSGEWHALLEAQDGLKASMETIPDRTKIYDRLESAKELKKREREEQDELLRPLRSAEIAFEGVKGYIHQLQVRRRHGPTKGSSILSLERLLEVWQSRVAQIEHFQSNGCTPEELIDAIRVLEKDMALAGTYAVKVIQVERRVQMIQSLHKRLRRRYPSFRLPEEEREKITNAARSGFAELWLAARWDELVDALNVTLEDIRVYEYLVLSRVWHLHAGTFDQLVRTVFDLKSTRIKTEMQINPQQDAGVRKAAQGSAGVSPFAGRVREHANEDSARYVKPRTGKSKR